MYPSDFTQRVAKSYSITGFVKNEPDGTVWICQPAMPKLELTIFRSEEKPKAKLMISKN
jgi:acylphosphatase